LIKDILDHLPKKRKVLVFINPFGGAGAAAANWLIARPMFELAGSRIEYTVLETERRNHAFDYVQKMEIGIFDGIVSVSGDGLLHEIVNGLLLR
jgi:sphingosine kinase